jgi:monofunctional biosynthetic peptidoglycan transglycosylase
VSGVAERAGRACLALLVIAALSLAAVLPSLGSRRWRGLDPHVDGLSALEAWRLATQKGALAWSHAWLPSARISANLKRAVIASEDAGFSDHSGVEWDALEKAWERNQKAEAAFAAARPAGPAARRRPDCPAAAAARAPKIVGGSTITQQLAKNLFLGGERSLARKGQEIVVTAFPRSLLSKDRILEIYLNSVEWGEGVFGAEAAGAPLLPYRRGQPVRRSGGAAGCAAAGAEAIREAAGVSVRAGRAATIMARMGAVDVP